MNARARLAFFGDDDDDLNLQQKKVDEEKVKGFSQGIQRKSKREREKEAEEAKKLEAERDTAKAYDEFLNEFGGVPSSGSAPVKGGFVRASGGGAYELSSVKKDIVPTGPAAMRERPPSPAAVPPKGKGKRAMDAFLEELKRDQADREARLKSRTAVTGTSVTALAAYETQVGSRDRGDPLTTNIFVANLPPGVTENSMGNFFARVGPVGSIKIMWPRGDANGGPGSDITSRRGRTGGMSGFVSFMTRKDAEQCVREMDGFDWGGSILRVGWSKSVPIAAKPMFELSRGPGSSRRSRSRSLDRPSKRTRYSRSRSRGRRDSYSRSRSRSRSPDRRRPRRSFSRSHSREGSRSRSRSHSRDRHGRQQYRRKQSASRSDSRHRSRSRSRSPDRRRSRSRSRSHSRSRRRSRSQHQDRSHKQRSSSPRSRRRRSYSSTRSRSLTPPVRRWPPIEPEAKAFVETVAKRVNHHGKDFERVLRQKERHNPKFTFLYDPAMPEFHLFKKLSTPDYKCPYDDIPFHEEGAVSVYSTDSAEESEKERIKKGTLGRLAEKRFEAMLRGLTGRRGELARCMTFALEHADAVQQVVDVIIQSLMVLDTPVPRKVARLFLICDILHNSAATIANAWKFRGEFQARLPGVFDHLSTIYHSFPGRMTADTFKKQILSVVEVWEDWIVFPADFTNELRQRLDGNETGGVGQTIESTMVDSTEQQDQDTSAAHASKFKTGGFKPAAFEPAIEQVDDTNQAPTETAEASDDDMVIEDDDVDGEAAEDIDGMAVDDLDGGEL